MAKNISCTIHGETGACMICQPLRNEKGLGYALVLVKPEEDDYETALCESCERLLLEEHGWTDKLYEYADWNLNCRICYENTLKSHSLVAKGYMK